MLPYPCGLLGRGVLSRHQAVEDAMKHQRSPSLLVIHVGRSLSISTSTLICRLRRPSIFAEDGGQLAQESFKAMAY